MALNFPTGPTSGATYTYSGKTWQWNGYAWDIVSPSFVNTLNGLTGAIEITAGSNISISRLGNTLTIASSSTGGGGAAAIGITGSIQYKYGSGTTGSQYFKIAANGITSDDIPYQENILYFLGATTSSDQPNQKGLVFQLNNGYSPNQGGSSVIRSTGRDNGTTAQDGAYNVQNLQFAAPKGTTAWDNTSTISFSFWDESQVSANSYTHKDALILSCNSLSEDVTLYSPAILNNFANAVQASRLNVTNSITANSISAVNSYVSIYRSANPSLENVTIQSGYHTGEESYALGVQIGDVSGVADNTYFNVNVNASSFDFISPSTSTSQVRVFTLDGLGLYNASPLKFYDIQETPGYVGFKAPDIAGNVTWTLPGSDGSSNQVLTTNGSGILSWTTPSGGSGSGTAYVPLASATVTGVASFGNQFVVSTAGAVGLTSNYVISVNGLTGAVVGIATTGSNTFTGLQTMNAGLTASNLYVANGATFAARASFNAGLSSANLFVSGGGTFGTSVSISGGTAWHANNDGKNSGLDADLLRGVNGDRILEEIQSGLLYGGVLSINGTTGFNVSAGAGVISTVNASLTGYPAPTLTTITWNSFTGQAVTGLTSGDFTFVRIDSSGNLQQSTSDFTQSQYLNSVVLGNLVHPNRSTLDRVHSHPIVAYASSAQYETFIRYFGPLKVSGYAMSGYGTTGQVQVSSGIAFALGANMENDPNNPSLVTDSANTPLSTFYYLYRNADGSYKTNPTTSTIVNFGNYDNGSGTLAGVSANKWSIQRVYKIPSTSVVYVYYGRDTYGTDTAAIAAVLSESFDEADITRYNGVFLGWLIVRGGGTDVGNTSDCRIIPGGFFRNTTGGGGAATVANLDDLGDVVITTPSSNQILRYDSTQGLWVNSPVSNVAVTTFNGASGPVSFAVPLASATVTGVASFGNEFVVTSGAVGLTSNYVKSVNGLTGTVVGIATTGSNTFTGLQTMNAGLTANNLYVSQGATFASPIQGTAASFTGLVSSTIGFSGSAANLVGNASGLTAGTSSKVQVTEAVSSTSYSLALVGSTGATGIYTDTSAPKWSYLPSTGRLTTTSGGFQAPTVETDNIVSVAGTSPLYIKTPWNAPNAQQIVIGDVDVNNNGTILQVDDVGGSFILQGIGETQIQTSGGLALYNQYSLVFYDVQDPAGYVAFKAPDIATNVTWTLPSADGSSNQVLTTNGSGTLSWTTPSGGGGSSVTSFNGLTGAVTGVSRVNGFTGGITFAAGTGITLTASGNTITVASAPKSTTQTLNFSENINGLEIVAYGTGNDFSTSLKYIEKLTSIAVSVNSYTCTLVSIQSFYDATNGWSARLIVKPPFAGNISAETIYLEPISSVSISGYSGGALTDDTWSSIASSKIYHQEETYVTKTVTGQSWVAADSYITCKVLGLTTADHTPEDAILEGVQFEINNIVAGTGFDIIGHAPEGTYGKYTVKCIEQ